MIKKILPLVMIFLLIGMMGTTQAQQQPLPIAVKVLNDQNVEGLYITVRNVRTGEQMEQFTNNAGEAIFDWANSRLKFSDGDRFIVTFLDMTQEFVYTGKAVPIIVFDLYGKFPDCPLDIVCPPKVDCPTCQICDTCQTCDTCEECQVCEEVDENKALELLLGVIVGAGVSGAAVYVRLGQKAQHYHRGIRSYHSIFTRHRDPDISHPRGELAPVYRKNTEGKYVYIPEEER